MIFSLSLPTRLASSLQISLHASLIVHFDTQGYVLFVIYVKKIKNFLNIHFFCISITFISTPSLKFWKF